jgi:hypothetical protein
MNFLSNRYPYYWDQYPQYTSQHFWKWVCHPVCQYTRGAEGCHHSKEAQFSTVVNLILQSFLQFRNQMKYKRHFTLGMN